MRSSEEYNSILKVLQYYAIHDAKKGVSFHCQYYNNKPTKSVSSSSISRTNRIAPNNNKNSSRSNRTDLNTSSVLRRIIVQTNPNHEQQQQQHRLEAQDQEQEITTTMMKQVIIEITCVFF